jgi:signal peptidase I
MEEKNIQNDRERFYGVGRFLWEIIKVFILAVVIITPIRVFLLQPFFVQGASMEPNFDDGQYLIVNELGYKTTNIGVNNFHLFTVNPFKELKRGDIVIFRYPLEPSQFFIKRVIGLPGERVRIENGHVTIFNNSNLNGFVLDENAYLASSVVTNGNIDTQLTDSQYFVMGDNRSYSHDSRAFGPIPQNDVVGKVMFRAWPFNKAQIY